jgi:hypothetical protein
MNELNMIRTLLDEAPPSAEVIAEGRQRIAASSPGPGRSRAREGLARAGAGPVADRPPRPGRAGALAGRPAPGFLLAMAIKAGNSQVTGRYWCSETESGSREVVGPGDTTLQPPWEEGPALADYRYAIITRTLLWTCMEPPRPGWPGGTVGNIHQALGATPASPPDVAAWRRAGSPRSWKAWYGNVTISGSAGPRVSLPDKTGWMPGESYAALPTSPAKLKAVFLAHPQYFGNNTGTRSEILADDAIVVMGGSATPAVRAAAYRVLADVPGIQMKPDVRDPAGQSGTAVWISQPRQPALSWTIVDPATGNLLCIEAVAQQPVARAPAGTVLDYKLFLTLGWTNTPPES